MGANIRVYDNGGKTADRYTLVIRSDRAGYVEMWGFNSYPFHPQGIGMYAGDYRMMKSYSHLGKLVSVSSLPEQAQIFVKQVVSDSGKKLPKTNPGKGYHRAKYEAAMREEYQATTPQATSYALGQARAHRLSAEASNRNPSIPVKYKVHHNRDWDEYVAMAYVIIGGKTEPLTTSYESSKEDANESLGYIKQHIQKLRLTYIADKADLNRVRRKLGYSKARGNPSQVLCRCCGKPVYSSDRHPIHTKCIPKHWGKHAKGIDASKCKEFGKKNPGVTGGVFPYNMLGIMNPKKDKTPTVTIFRKWPNGRIIAIFPEVVGDFYKYRCMMYEHVGQHGAGDPVEVIKKTKPATISEYTDLKKELESIGYKIKVAQKYTWFMQRKRFSEWGKLNKNPGKGYHDTRATDLKQANREYPQNTRYGVGYMEGRIDESKLSSSKSNPYQTGGVFPYNMLGIMNPKTYVITGYVKSKGFRDRITKPNTKANTQKTLNQLKRDMKIAIPSYRWVSDLKIEESLQPQLNPVYKKPSPNFPNIGDAVVINQGPTKGDRGTVIGYSKFTRGWRAVIQCGHSMYCLAVPKEFNVVRKVGPQGILATGRANPRKK